jgi:hypothetical protein
MGKSGNGSNGPAVPVLGPKQGPPTVPVDQVYGMMRELEISHQIMDALGASQGPLPDRMVWWARDWLRRVGPASQTRIGIQARMMIRGAGQSLPYGAEEGEEDEGNRIEKKTVVRTPHKTSS